MTNGLTELNKISEEFLSSLSWEKKSVRTTFKLSQEATEMLTTLTESKGETMKDFFDTLCFSLMFREAIRANDPMLAKLNDQDNKIEIEKLQRQVRKTYVISKTARKQLAKFAEKYKLSRDAFVEHAVRFENESIKERVEEKRRKHARAFEILGPKWAELEQTLSELRDLLGRDDPIYDGFSEVCIRMMFLCNDLEAELKEGTPQE